MFGHHTLWTVIPIPISYSSEYTTLHHNALHCTTLQNNAQHCTLRSITLTTLSCPTLHYATLHCATLHYFTFQYPKLACLASYVIMSETWTDAVCLRAGVPQARAVLPAGLVRGIRGGAAAHCAGKGRPRPDARAARGLHQVPQIQTGSVWGRSSQLTSGWNSVMLSEWTVLCRVTPWRAVSWNIWAN